MPPQHWHRVRETHHAERLAQWLLTDGLLPHPQDLSPGHPLSGQVVSLGSRMAEGDSHPHRQTPHHSGRA